MAEPVLPITGGTFLAIPPAPISPATIGVFPRKRTFAQSLQQSLTLHDSFSSHNMLITTANLGWPCKIARQPVASKTVRCATSSLEAVIPTVELLVTVSYTHLRAHET